jgi:16S rRNA (adenine1518-N6/adenine1519-N6)-dimethyltransferase
VGKSAKLGQNFLRDKNIALRIVGLLEASSGPLLEIGAGKGILSELLVEKFPSRRITLVEIDPVMVTELEYRFGDRAGITAGDILRTDLAEIYPKERVSVIGNLPYHISKPLIDWFIAQRQKICEGVLMLQKDFVDKLLAEAGSKKYNAQSVIFQLFFHTRRCFDVPPGAFAPTPKIMSTVLAIRSADSPLQSEADEFYDFVKLCFAGRRKTLWNNLSLFHPQDRLRAAFNSVGLSSSVRAEEIHPRFFPPLYRLLKNR